MSKKEIIALRRALEKPHVIQAKSGVMEKELEARLDQDKVAIQAVTQQEMRKALLRNKIAALRNTRSRLTAENQAFDEQGNALRGRRKFQEFYVTEKQVTRKVMQRLQFPKEELDRLEAEEEAERALAQGVPTADALGATATAAAAAAAAAEEDEDACLMVGDEDDVPIEASRVHTLAKPVIKPLAAVRPVHVVQPAAPAAPAKAPAPAKKMDEIDRALAELARDDKAKTRRASAQGKKISTRGKAHASHVSK
jgi:hypothetical protein